MRKELRDFVIVKVRSVFKDETMYKGYDGQKIFIDVTFDPQRHTNNCGYVASVPVNLCREPIYFRATGLPRYAEKPPMEYRSMADIEMEIQDGDKVYFNYNTLLPDTHEEIYNAWYVGHEYVEDEDGQLVNWLYFKVKYSQIYCAIRYEKTNPHYKDFDWKMESKLIASKLEVENEIVDRYQFEDNVYRKTVQMIGSWVFIEPDKETWESISIPVAEVEHGLPVLDLNGKPKFKPQDEWILKKPMPENKYLFGWVRHVGTPLRGDFLEIAPGLHVMYRPFTNTAIEVEGVEYHRMLQSNVVAKFPYKKAI